MIDIDVNQFCYLSSNNVFLGWLRAVDSSIYDDLVAHLRLAQGCASNRLKMIEVLNNLQSGGSAEALEQFIRQEFPALIREQVVSSNHKSDNKHGVFKHYNPQLRTIPKRHIIVNSDLDVLRRSVLQFCAKQAYCEHVIVEDHAYIEYLTSEMMVKKDKIPARNWQVRKFRR